MAGISEQSEIFTYIKRECLIQKYSFDGRLVEEYGPIKGPIDSIEITENGKILINDTTNFKLKILEIR